MNVLIIGSSGFIGSYCYKHLVSKGYSVFCSDINSINSPHEFFLLDPVNTDFDKIFKDTKFDICINASGAASVPFSLENPIQDFILNTGNVVKILEAIRLFSPNCFLINFSSAAIYGNPIKLPVTESMKPKPMSPYGWHKYYAEQICKEYSHFFNIKTCNLRVFSAYGPGLKKQFFWDLFNKLENKKELELFGTGHESRDFIFVEDIAQSVELIIENRFSLPDIINVASGNETSIHDAAQIFNELVNKGNQIRFSGKVRLGDPLNWKADINILRSIGFRPSHTLKKGLEKYKIWVQKEKKLD